MGRRERVLDTVIEIIVTHPGGRDTAEAEDPESAVVAARTLWDESLMSTSTAQSGKRAIMFLVGGKLVRLLEVRP